MRAKVYAVIILLLVTMLHGIYAQVLPDDADKARFGKAQSLNSIGRFREAGSILKELYTRYPDNIDIKIELVKALRQGGDVKASDPIIDGLLDDYPVYKSDPDKVKRVIELLVYFRLHDKAIGLSRRYLDERPEDVSVRLLLARILSWARYYEESVELYSKLIEEDPDNMDLYREKAHVLGWMRRYKDAVDTYQSAGKGVAAGPLIETEMKAKKNFYNSHYKKAEIYYRQWLDYEPANLEALFDLGQIYSTQGRWEEAEEIYLKVLGIFPNHQQAVQALEAVKRLRDRKRIVTGFELYEADSDSRLVDRKFYNIYKEIIIPLKQGLYAGLRNDSRIYSFSDLSSVHNETAILSVDFYDKPWLWASVGYDFESYSDSLKEHHNIFSKLNYKPHDMLQLGLSYRNSDVIENADTLKRGIRKKDLDVRCEAYPDRRLKIGADYRAGFYTDGNKKDTLGADFSYEVLLEPRRLKVRYRYETYGFTKPNDVYFSPDSFHFNEISVEWQHFLNKEELFWGAKDTFYLLRYAVNFDVHDQTGHSLDLELHKDWTDNFSTHVNCRKKIYEHEKIYSEDTITVYAKYYF